MSDTRREAGGAKRETRRARFDETIDRAVREMLDVEPPSGLRGRVLDRIDALSTNSVASAFRRKFGWIAVPVAAAAVIILAVLGPWRHAVAPVSSSGPIIAKVKPTAPPQDTQAPSLSPRTIATHPPALMPAGRPQSPRSIQEHLVVATDAPNDLDSQIEPLTPIAPITVAGTHPEDIAPKQIAISPLAAIAELQIAPLSPPERRN